MKFTLTSEFVGFGSPKNTMEFEVDHIGDVIAYFEQFLRGSGYHFDGHLDLIDEEEHGCCGSCHSDEEEELYDSKDVMAMPGTIGCATLVTSFNDKCKVCGLTRQQLGEHSCYDTKCGLK